MTISSSRHHSNNGDSNTSQHSRWTTPLASALFAAGLSSVFALASTQDEQQQQQRLEHDLAETAAVLALLPPLNLGAPISDSPDADSVGAVDEDNYDAMFETEEQMEEFLKSLGINEQELEAFDNADEATRAAFIASLRARLSSESIMTALSREDVDRPITMADAVAVGNPDLIDFLISKGHSVNEPSRETTLTPLVAAIEGKNVATARHLLSRGAAVNAPTLNGLTPLFRALLEPDTLRPAQEMVQLLLKAGADPNLPMPGSGALPLHTAIQRFSPVFAAMLIKAGAGVNTQAPGTGETPVFLAARVGDTATLSTLLKQRDVQVDTPNAADFTPLVSALLNHNNDVAGLLVAAGADLTHVNKHGASPVFAAVMTNNAAALAAMLSRRSAPVPADANAAVHGKPLLQWALERGNAGAVWALAKAGADADAPFVAAAADGPSSSGSSSSASASASAPAHQRTLREFAEASNDVLADLLLLPAGELPERAPVALSDGEMAAYVAEIKEKALKYKSK